MDGGNIGLAEMPVVVVIIVLVSWSTDTKVLKRGETREAAKQQIRHPIDTYPCLQSGPQHTFRGSWDDDGGERSLVLSVLKCGQQYNCVVDSGTIPRSNIAVVA